MWNPNITITVILTPMDENEKVTKGDEAAPSSTAPMEEENEKKKNEDEERHRSIGINKGSKTVNINI